MASNYRFSHGSGCIQINFLPFMKGNTMKKALITGITEQDGSYLAELLLKKGYEVYGLIRRSSSFNTQRIDHLYKDPHERNVNMLLHYGDMTDSTSLIRLLQEIRPDEIYNLAAQSHVMVSFETPEYTSETVGVGTLKLLEAIRILGLQSKTKFYQASTKGLYISGLFQFKTITAVLFERSFIFFPHTISS